MNRILRPAALVFSLLLLQLALFSELRISGRAPDLLLVAAIAAGLTGGPDRGAITGFVGGLAVDLFLPTPLGLSALAYSFAGWAVGQTENAIVGEHPWIVMPLSAAGATIGVTAFVTVGELLGQPNLYTERFLGTVVVTALYNAVLAWPVARLFRWAWTSPGVGPPDRPRDRASRRVVN